MNADVMLLINKCANQDIAPYGKYEAVTFAQHFKISLDDVSFLAKYGFTEVEYQHIEGRTGEFRTLYTFTQRWRNLQKFASCEALIAWENEESRKIEEQKEVERDFIKKQRDFLTISRALADKQIELSDNQIAANRSTVETNKLSKISNIYVAIFTGIAGVYYLSELLRSYIPYYTPHKFAIKVIILSACVGAGIYGYIKMHQANRRR